MIFDIKLGENFRIKARLVGGGHTRTAPSSITFSLVVSRDSVRISLTIASLNELDILACDIQNAHLTSLCREKIWTFGIWRRRGHIDACKNGNIWTKVIRRSIMIQARGSTEGCWLPFHKRVSICIDPTGSKTIWHRIPRNGIMLCRQRIGNIGNTNENY